MKSILSFAAIACLFLSSLSVSAQHNDDKSKRASLPATVSETIPGNVTVTIDYSQPLLKNRTIGKDVEPMQGKIWRAGANEATTFEVSKDVKVDGKALPAGKYALFMIDNAQEWTIIFNKKWNTWGAYDYDKNKGDDALQVKVKPGTASPKAVKLTYTISKKGKVSLMWGDRQVDFMVK